jgi:hypothetical protein
MKPSNYEQKVTTVNMELLSLKEDLERVKTPGIKRHLENVILQKETQLSLLIKKHINGSLTQTPAIQPSTEKETPPCQTIKVIRRSGSR